MNGVMHTDKYHGSSVKPLQLESDDITYRKEQTKSVIHEEKTKDNFHLTYCQNWNKQISKVLKENNLKRRSNSVMLIGTVYSATPEFFENMTSEKIKKYFQDCEDFHVKHYCQGDKSRLISSVVHMDEKTPHGQFYSVPLYTRKDGSVHLSARDLIGNKHEMAHLQDLFYEEVGKKWKLEPQRKQNPKNPVKHSDRVEYWENKIKELQIQNDALEAQIQKYEKRIINLESRIAKLEAKNKETTDRYETVVKKYNKIANSYNSALEEKNKIIKDIEDLNIEFDKLLQSPKIEELTFKQFLSEEGLLNKFQDFKYKYKSYKTWKPKNFTEIKKKVKEFEK